MFTKKTRVISMIATVAMLLSLMASICIPAYADDVDLSLYPSVSTVTAAVTGGDYVITNEDDWEYLETNIEYFRNKDVVIHLGADIDLSAIEFISFQSPAFSFDGHGYTVSGWGTAEEPIVSQGMFFTNDANGLGYLKNLVLYDCHAAHANFGSALVYGVSHANAGIVGLPADFVMDNITLDSCSFEATATAECAALLLTRYTPNNANSVVTVSNITIVGSELTAPANNHCALLIGKPRADYTSDDAGAGPYTNTYNISNCYIYDNIVNASRDNNGFLVGTAENDGKRTIVNFSNIAMIGNTMDVTADTGDTSKNQQALIGDVQGSAITMNGVVANNNSLIKNDDDFAGDIYLVINGSGITNCTNVYSDTELKALASMNADAKLTGKVINEAAAYALNAAATEDSAIFWSFYDGELMTTTKDSSMRKIEMKLATNGRIMKTLYAEGGTEVTLEFEDSTATFSTENAAATIDGNVLTMPTDGTDVEVLITLGTEGEMILAKSDLQDACDFFNDKNLSYYAEGLAEKLAEAEALIENEEAAAIEIYALKDELAAWDYATAPNLPSTSEIAKYPDAPGYMINNATDLIAAKGKEVDFTADHTLYLGADIDLTGVNFTGFGSAAKFKFDGMNHSIKNWTVGSASTNQAFFMRSNVTSIKNVTFDNVQMTGIAHTAIVYGSHASDVVTSERLVIENVHVKNSVINSASEQAAMFVAGVQNTRTGGYEIVGCSIVDSKIDGSNKGTGSGNNYAGFIGRFTDSWPASSTVVVKNCLTDNFDIIAGGNQVGVLVGAALGAQNTAAGQIHVSNCVLTDCDVTATGDIGLVVARCGGPAPQVKNIVVNKCTAVSDFTNAYKWASAAALTYGNVDNIPFWNIYLSNEWTKDWYVNNHAPANVTNFEDRAKLEKYAAEKYTSGELAYELNAMARDAGYGFWAMADGAMTLAAAKDSTVKVSVQATSGAELAAYYVNSNGTVTLNVPDAVSYAVAAESAATIEGTTLTLAGDGKDVVVVATLQGAAQKELYLNQIATLTAYFDAFTAGPLSTELAALVANAKNMTNATDITVMEEAVIALQEAFEKGAYSPVVTAVDTYPEATAYSVWTKADWEYLSANHAKFNRTGVVIYIADDIDMTGSSSFSTMGNSKIAIDGLNNKIFNWDRNGYAIFSGNYQGGFVKNLTFENVKMAGGYSRSILFSEYGGGDVLIENVDMINVTLDANASGNQMGLYLSRTNGSTNEITFTIKDCVVKNSKLENSCNATINNCGILVGCMKSSKDTLVVENVDIINCENNTETLAGGLAIGSLECKGGAIIKDLGVFGGTITTGTIPYVGVVVGTMAENVPVSFENVIAMDVESIAAQTWLNVDQNYTGNANITAEDCAADFGGVTKIVHHGTGEHLADKVIDDLAGVTKTSDMYEAAYIVGRYVSDAGYPSTTKGEGYANTYKISFEDQSEGTPVPVATFYTLADGTLPSSAATVLGNDFYQWKFNGADVDANTVFTADSTVISLSEHDFTGAVEPVDDNTHKVYCADDGCNAYKIVDCSAKDYEHKMNSADEHVHTAICACGNELDTEKCTITYNHVEGTMTHTGTCSVCEFTTAPIACTMDEGVIKPGDEASATQPGKKTFSCTAGCGNETYEFMAQLASATVVVEAADSVVPGEDVEVELKLSGNAVPGVNGFVVELTYDANAMTIANEDAVVLNGFVGVIEISEVAGVGTLKIALAADQPITTDMTFATITFNTSDAEGIDGEKALDIAVSDAGYSATDVDDATWYELIMEAEGTSIEFSSYTWGDVNRDDKVTISDVVMILRALNGSLEMDQIDDKAANVFTDDNYTDNKGVNNADAIALLRYLLNK